MHHHRPVQSAPASSRGSFRQLGRCIRAAKARSKLLRALFWKRRLSQMEVRFAPDVQMKLEQLARETGRPSDELVQDAVIGYFDELAHTREFARPALRRFGKRQGEARRRR